MGLLAKIVFLVVSGAVILVGIKLNKCLESIPAPKMDEPYWGPGKPVKDNTEVRPFKINVSDEVLVDLIARLNSHRDLIAPLEGAKQHYGMNSNLLKEILDFWRTKYDWRQREKFLNKFPQFKTKVQGLDIHFLHVKPTAKDVKVVPLLMLHGWPGSVREFYEIIPILTSKQPGRDFVFEVIAPSLPGYGFSDGAAKPGLGAAQVAVVFKNLMERLGFKKYYLQGGDWGALIVTHMAAFYGDRVLGVHSNMCYVGGPRAALKTLIFSVYPSLIVDKKLEHKIYPISGTLYKMMLELGYMHSQATKPDTLGFGLNDSPVGLAGYILEKFTTWTDPSMKNLDDGGLKSKFKYEDLLDNVMIYWVTNSITSSMRLYAETFNTQQESLRLSRVPVNVPSACASFAHEFAYYPEYILKDKFTNLVQNHNFDVGGHFAAFELPKMLAEDVFSAVTKMEDFHKQSSKQK